MVRRYYSRKFSGPAAEKNYVSYNTSGIGTGVQTTVDIAHCDNASLDDSIKAASKIKAVFVTASLFADIESDAATMGVLMAKIPGGLIGNLTNPNGALSSFTQQQTFLWLRMTPRTQQTAHNFIGWVKIPPRHQIFNEDDKLVWSMSITVPTGTYSHCSNFVYKHR